MLFTEAIMHKKNGYFLANNQFLPSLPNTEMKETSLNKNTFGIFVTHQQPATRWFPNQAWDFYKKSQLRCNNHYKAATLQASYIIYISCLRYVCPYMLMTYEQIYFATSTRFKALFFTPGYFNQISVVQILVLQLRSSLPGGYYFVPFTL